MKKWIIQNTKNLDIKLHKNRVINNLLLSRGMVDADIIDEFLYPNVSKLHNPFLLQDMDRAVERIDRAIEKRQKIVIYGDYDVDGITSTSILYRAFVKLGVEAHYYIPERMNEGYGINKEAISYIKSLQTDLIITVDCGITSMLEVEYAKSLGMDIIITDHHECKDTIPDTIVINPKRRDCLYPDKNLAGCGIAFKLVQALWLKYNLHGFEEFLDIATIGTIADVVKLTGENRIIVKNGLSKIDTSEKCGIKALKAVCEITGCVNTYNIAFQIAPRINAVGRLSDAKIAVELFVTNDYDKALQIAKFLDQENKRRQKIEETIINEANLMIKNTINLKTDRFIVLSSPKWHHGVVGIVASKLVELYNRPTILLCEHGDICKGSGRSIKGFDLFKGLNECRDFLIKYGGHEMAAGLTLEVKNINSLRETLNSICNKMDSEIFLEKMYAELEVYSEDINLETAELLKQFEPFGNGNSSPLLYMEDLQAVSMKGIGNSGQHLKAVLEKDGKTYDAILFNGSNEVLNKKLDRVDILFNLEINEWKNNRNLQFMLKDMRANSEWIKGNLSEDYFRYIKFMLNEKEHEKDYSFNKINFIKKEIAFLKDFLYFDRGYVLVSSYKALLEIETLLEAFEIYGNRNNEARAQIILCPNVESMEFYKNDILIYDFLPGSYEYKFLSDKTEGNIYNFYDEASLGLIDDFIRDINIDTNFCEIFINDLIKSDIIGTIKEIAEKYKKNSYLTYKIIMFLKENQIAEVMIKNDTLKIHGRNNCTFENINFDSINLCTNKLANVKIKFSSLLREV